MAQCVALPCGALLQLTQQTVGNAGKLGRAQRIKQDNLVKAAHQLGTEKLLCLLYGLLAAALVFGRNSTEAQRRCLPGETPCPQIGGKQDDGVGKVCPAPLCIGQAAVL